MTRSRRAGPPALVLAAALALAPDAVSAAEPPAGAAAAAAPGDEVVEAFVELQGSPAVEAAMRVAAGRAAGSPASWVASATATRSLVSQLDRAQTRLTPALMSPEIGASVRFRYQRVLNGIAVAVRRDRLAAIARLPGVLEVHEVPPMRAANFSSVPLVGAPAVWSAAGAGMTGSGVRVGVIDTGIDYLHRDFGGSGDYQGQSYSDAIVPWTAKVVGGRDFYSNDSDPMDSCNGHGTHVAGTIGGYGVNGDGSTFAGPWGVATDFSALRIGPGVAPGAQLYALRVLGCDGRGSWSATVAAVEWSVDPDGDGSFADRLDVINLSLGTWFGYGGSSAERALDNAVLAGVVAVAAAGNDGDVHYVTLTPAGATRAISVASSIDLTAVTGAFRVNAPAAIAGDYPAGEAEFGADLAEDGDTAGTLVYPAGNQNGCLPYAAGTFSGRIALVDRGSCSFVIKVKNTQVAGAVGTLIANHVTGLPFSMGGADGSITIPAMLTTQAVGATLKAALAGGEVEVTLTAALRNMLRNVDPAGVDTVSSFSSRGPRRPDGALKPEIAAPGDTIFSARALSGEQGLGLNGTSMATPHVAGAMAVLRGLHPDWSVEELKALTMNTAGHELYQVANGVAPAHGPGRVGAGRLDVAAAASATAVAFSTANPGAVSVAFGVLEVAGSGEWTETVKVVNKGAAAQTFQLGYSGIATVAGTTVDFPDGASVSVPGGGEATFRVRLRAEAAQLRHEHDPALTTVQGDAPRHWLTEAAGLVTLTPAAGQPLRLPLHAAVRPAATMSGAPAAIPLTGATTAATLALAGVGVATGTDFPVAVQSLVTALELHDEWPQETSRRAGRLRAIGVASDYPARAAAGGALADSWVYFGIAGQGDWNTPNEMTPSVEIDTDRDGDRDFTLTGTDVSGAHTSDVFIAALCPVSGPNSACVSAYLNGISAAVRDTAPFDTNVMVLPVALGELGLSAQAPVFNYRVVLRSLDRGSDQSSWRPYDPTRPGIAFGGVDLAGAPARLPLYADLPGGTIPLVVDAGGAVTNGARGVLLLHHHNRSGERVQTIGLAGQTDLAVTLDGAPDTVAVGGSLTYTITVINNGPLPAGEVEVIAKRSSGAALAGAVASQGACSGSSTVTCTLGLVEVGSIATVTVNVTPGAAGLLTSTATVSCGWSDAIVGNNTAGAVTVVGTGSTVTTYRVPSVAHTTGTGGTVWRSAVAAVNGNAAAADLTLTYRADGAPITRTATVASGATVEWPDILVSLFELADSAKSSGSLEVSASVPLEMTSRTFNQGTSGTYGQSYPALLSSEGIFQGIVGVLPQVRKTTTTRTNIGAQNLSTSSCSVRVRLFGADGAAIGSARTMSLAAGAWAQLNDVGALFGAATLPLAYALVEVTASGCVAWPYASVVDSGTGDPTTIPVLFGLPPGPYLVPSVAHTTGAGGTVWRTDIAAVNRSGVPSALTLTFVSDTHNIVRTATLAADATTEWPDILVGLFGFAAGAKASGTVRIDSTVPLAITSRTYNQGADGTYGQFYPALTAANAIPAGAVGVLPQLEKSSAARTNVGVQNLGDAPATVLVRVHSQSGSALGNAVPLTVAAGRWAQINDVFAAAGAGSRELAYAVVEVQTAGGKMWAYASVIDAVTGDPTTIPVVVR